MNTMKKFAMIAALFVLLCGAWGTANAQTEKGKAVLRFRFAATDSVNYRREGLCVKCYTDRAQESGMFDSLAVVGDGYYELVIDEVSDFVAYYNTFFTPDNERIDVMGAVIYSGDTLYMDMKGNKERNRYDVAFRGPKRSVEASRIFSDAAYAFASALQYALWDDNSNIAGYRLDEAQREAQIFEKKYKNSKVLKRDATLRHLIDIYKVRGKLILPLEHKNITEGLAASGIDTTGAHVCYDPVFYDSLMGTLDINDPMLLPADLVNNKLHSMRPDSVSVYKMDYQQAVEDIARFDKLITLLPTRQLYIDDLAKNLFLRKHPGITIEQYEDLYERIKAFCPLEEKVLAGYAQYIEAKRNLASLTVCPDVTLHTPDGQSLLLSSLFDKVLYIDFWASWCIPCRKEGPALDKLASKYRDNDNIAFISISTDFGEKNWHKALEEDKPWWPQYMLPSDSTREFQKALNINTIPRFVLLGRGGKILESDAPRPSDENKVTEVIDAALKR